MASLLINGLKMPKPGDKIVFIVNEYGQLLANCTDEDGVGSNHAVFEVKTPHGSGVDTDKLKDSLMKLEHFTIRNIKNLIDSTPILIPPETRCEDTEFEVARSLDATVRSNEDH